MTGRAAAYDFGRSTCRAALAEDGMRLVALARESQPEVVWEALTFALTGRQGHG